MADSPMALNGNSQNDADYGGGKMVELSMGANQDLWGKVLMGK